VTTFFRVLDVPVESKAAALRECIAVVGGSGETERVFERDERLLGAIPGSPFAYWVSDQLRDTFQRLERFESHERTAKCGMGTLDDFRFLRSRHELGSSSAERGWVNYVGPRQRSLTYADLVLQVNWRSEGRELKVFVESRVGSASRKIQSEGYYFRSGLAWPLRGSRFSAQEVPSGCVFSVAGKMAFVPDEDRLFFLGLFNSAVFDRLIGLFAGKVGGVQYEAGLIQDLPIPEGSVADRLRMGELAAEAWRRAQSIDSENETSTAFILPPPLSKRCFGLDRATEVRELSRIQSQIDDLAYSIYGMGVEDRHAIEASAHTAGSDDSEEDSAESSEVDEAESEDQPDEESCAALISWFAGVAFARFDARVATGERPPSSPRKPFDPLPSRSPGMYPKGEEPAARPDILVDDEGHPDDLAGRAQAVADRVKVDAPENLRGWLSKEFFPLHIKMYSKSRRKAPIYWQLATPSAGYSVWLYLHAVSKDTLFRVQNDYVAPKLAHEERRLESLTSELRDGATADQRKQLAAQEALVEELRAFLDEVKRVAPLWKPNLDDGVILIFAPLWRLVPQNKGWQKELKSTWDALCEGKNDWAHLAMHLWPERVVLKCAKDRSVAIAHGLEDVFWVEGTGGKWTARKTPALSVDELVRQRTSPAVNAALKNLLEAPVAQGGSGRGRGGGGRAAASADEGGSR
jgi:hypothetical protein